MSLMYFLMKNPLRHECAFLSSIAPCAKFPKPAPAYTTVRPLSRRSCIADPRRLRAALAHRPVKTIDHLRWYEARRQKTGRAFHEAACTRKRLPHEPSPLPSGDFPAGPPVVACPFLSARRGRRRRAAQPITAWQGRRGRRQRKVGSGQNAICRPIELYVGAVGVIACWGVD